MSLSVCGFNHKSANLQDREIFQIPRANLPQAVSDYKKITGAKEIVIVSTCNRVEFYRVYDQKSNQYEELIEFYKHRGVDDPSILRDICFCHHGTTAARHLFRVACGLDSLVLGEDQIIHQLKESYSSACAVDGPGTISHKVFHLAFQISKKVRSETKLTTGPRNIPSAALRLLLRQMSGEIPRKAVICGVNNLSEILLEHLTRRKIHTTLANRTLYHAQKMAGGYGADSASLDKLDTLLQDADVVFTVTGSTEYLITPEQVKTLSESGRKIYFVDISVPRNVDPAVGELKGMKLLDLQDLKRHLDVSVHQRSGEIPLIEAKIEDQVGVYSLWRSKIARQDKILQLKDTLNNVRMSELDKVKQSFRQGDQKTLDALTNSIMREFLRVAPNLLDDNETLVDLE